jgi:hypothetical protein
VRTEAVTLQYIIAIINSKAHAPVEVREGGIVVFAFTIVVENSECGANVALFV